jgi:hypothetical protein
MERAICSCALIALCAMATTVQAQESKPRSTIAQSLTPPAYPQAKVENSLIEFPLPNGEEKYRSIDGRMIHRYVEELARISLKYRDAGHPKFWGRIIGTESDRETENWLADKFRELGLADVRIQHLALPPQWMPRSWDVGAASLT